MTAAITRHAISRPVPDATRKTYVTCAPTLANDHLSNGMESQRRTTHSLQSSSPLNRDTNNAAYSGHTRPAGATTPYQNAPLDLTKPLDLSVKRAQSSERKIDCGFTQFHRQTPADTLNGRNSSAVVAPFNFTEIHKDDVPLMRPSVEYAKNCCRRVGLLASSPRNYNHKGRAMVAPRRAHVSEMLQQNVHAEPTGPHSTLLKHGHMHMQSHSSVPLTSVRHSHSPAKSFSVSSSSSDHVSMLPSYQASTSSHHAMHHELRHILPKPSVETRTIDAPDVSEGHLTPARIAHVTALSHTATTLAHTLTPTTQSHSVASFEVKEHIRDRTHQCNTALGYHAMSGNNLHQRCRNSLSNGTLSIQNQQKKTHRSRSVTPMRPKKTSADRNNLRVLKMLETSIIAAAKLNKLLKPIDGPETSAFLSDNTHVTKHESNNNYTQGLVTYQQPLRVDIPEHHSRSVPPRLPNAFANDRVLAVADRRLHHLLPPSNTVSIERISPTMPVLVPHNIYSPVELPTSNTRASDSSLPVLKNAEVERNMSPGPIFNPLTLPFLSPVADSRRVQTVPPIILEPQKNDDSRCASHIRQSLHHNVASGNSSLHHKDVVQGGLNHIGRCEFDKFLAQLGRKNTSTTLRQTNSNVSHSAATAAFSDTGSLLNTTSSFLSSPVQSHAAVYTPRSNENNREIYHKMLLQKRTVTDQVLQSAAKNLEVDRKITHEVVDLTCSPPPSPEVMIEDNPDVIEKTSTQWNINSSLPSNNLPCGVANNLVTEAGTNKPPCDVAGSVVSVTDPGKNRLHCGVAGNVVSVAEAVGTAYEALHLNESYTDLDQKVNKQIISEVDVECVRPISKVLNTKFTTDAHKAEADSFCRRHRQLLYSSSSTPHEKKYVVDIPFESETATLPHLIIEHCFSHDPRKKHLATLNPLKEMKPAKSLIPPAGIPSTSSIHVPTPENTPESFPNVAAGPVASTCSPIPSTCSPISSTCSPISNTENIERRRRKSNLEINRMANTASYVADVPKKPKTGDLLVDSSLLDREERALQIVPGGESMSYTQLRRTIEEPTSRNFVSPQRAMLRFSEMEQKERFGTFGNNSTEDTVQKVQGIQKKRRPGRPSRGRGRGRGLNRATKLMKVGRRGRFSWRVGRRQVVKRGKPLRKRALQLSILRKDVPKGDDDKTEPKSTTSEYQCEESRSSNEGSCTRRNSVRKRTPYHKNARYELEIEKEEAKLVERKRKRTVSFGSNSGDTTDESTPLPAPATDNSPVVVKRRRGRPRKNICKNAVLAASKRIEIKNKGVGRGRYPRAKKKLVMSDPCSDDVFTTESTTKSELCNNQCVPNSSFINCCLQRPLQVVMDPENHTKMKFVSVPRPARRTMKSLLFKDKPCGKRKRKTKHLGPVSPRTLVENEENIDDVYTFKQDDDDDDFQFRPYDRLKMRKTGDCQNSILSHHVDVQIKQEPVNHSYEPEVNVNQPPPVQTVLPEPPPELKRLICNKKLGETVLHRACRMAKDEVAIYCIDYKIYDINAQDNAGYTPLHECCVIGRLKIAEHLLCHGADANASAADGTRPLHDAVDNHHIEIVRLLLSFGADPLVATYSGRTVLKLARNNQMRAFIIGYLRDVNGQWEVDEEELPNYVDAIPDMQWRFRGSCSPLDLKVENGLDILNDIPNVDSDDVLEVDSDDVMFELSDSPHLPTYNLEFASNNGPRNYLLLTDVKMALGGKLDDLINMCDDVRPIRITRREFNYALKEGLTSLTTIDLPPKDHVSDPDTVELLELNDNIRRALGTDIEFVR